MTEAESNKATEPARKPPVKPGTPGLGLENIKKSSKPPIADKRNGPKDA